MNELVINLHMHTPYSDGYGTHTQIASDAIKAGLDAIIVTDHNVYVNGLQGYHQEGDKKVLVLVGEEIHDQTRIPQKNHLLVFGAGRELATLAPDVQLLLDAVQRHGGISFLAHPVDPQAPAVNQNDISWEDWQVHGYTGIELWNGFSEFKGRLKTKLHAIFYAYNPKQIAQGPFPGALTLWDNLLSRGKPVVAIGGSDAHGLPIRLGPLKRTVFPYQYHFRTVNTHLLNSKQLSGDPEIDANLILGALSRGNCFIGYDLPRSTRGFRFTAEADNGSAQMGDTLMIKNGATLKIRLPAEAECHLIKDGAKIKTWHKRTIHTYITTEPGVYRVEVFYDYLGRRRGWIFSNPIYLKGTI